MDSHAAGTIAAGVQLILLVVIIANMDLHAVVWEVVVVVAVLAGCG